jgi:hypothetical protein
MDPISRAVLGTRAIKKKKGYHLEETKKSSLKHWKEEGKTFSLLQKEIRMHATRELKIIIRMHATKNLMPHFLLA